MDGLSILVLSLAEDGDATVRLALARGEETVVAFPIARAANGVYALQPIDAVPRLFYFLPLIGTSGLGLPAVFHSASFEPTQDRDGLYLAQGEGPKTETNKRLLSRCVDVLAKAASACSRQGCGNLHELLLVHSSQGQNSWLTDLKWYQDFQRSLLEALADIPLVRTRRDEVIPSKRAIFPIGDGILPSDVLFRFASPLFAERLPDASITGTCSCMAGDWFQVLGGEHPLIASSILKPSRLLTTVREFRDLATLASSLGCEVDEAIGWLNNLIAAFPVAQRGTSFDGLLPDQNGVFRRHNDLSRDGGIDDLLKDVLEALGEPIRRTLLHRGVRHMDSVISRLESEDQVVPRVKDRLKRRCEDPTAAADPAFRSSCLSAFRWFTEKDRWTDLKDSFPVIALDRDGKEVVRKTSSGEAKLLAPRTLWPLEAHTFWDAFPPGSILVDEYSKRVPHSAWDLLAAEGIVLRNLLWSEEVEITDEQIERLALDRLPEGDHALVQGDEQKVVVGKLALVGTSEFSDAVRKSHERAARFLHFVLKYAATADDSWQKRTEVACECGKKHAIIPCDWLAWIRRTQWVPRGKHTEYATTESLAALMHREPELAPLMTREGLQAFLELIGVNVLEQALLGFDEGRRLQLRRKLAELTKLVSSPDEIDELVKNIEAARRMQRQWESSQALGRKVERLVKEVLDDLKLNYLKLKVEVRFVGYDLEAYLGTLTAPDEEDIGRLEVGVAKIEIKATRSSTVSMSNVQAKTAAAGPDRYWLCVVPVNADQPVDTLDSDEIRLRARFVPGIGHMLSPSQAELGDAVKAARNEGVELEHVDEIRYRVGRSVWESHGITVDAFVQQIVATVQVKVAQTGEATD